MSKVFIVVCEDRHADDRISVHLSRASADRRVDAFMAEYQEAAAENREDGYQWVEEPVEGWIRNVVTDSDDGPRARIESAELEP
ncbi:MAG TPA: hypothetical protein VFO62_10280 [Candidatus Binatia bacterium]|nr:hypothetical protein [Candidatus Binatia bacterium]